MDIRLMLRVPISLCPTVLRVDLAFLITKNEPQTIQIQASSRVRPSSNNVLIVRINVCMSMFARTLLTSAAKLPTSVDYWSHRIHALLGCYVFFHFIYRYYIFFSSNHDDMCFDGLNLHRIDDLREVKQQYVYFIQIFFPHLLLQASGFAFHIPLKRHPDGNRIWPLLGRH